MKLCFLLILFAASMHAVTAQQIVHGRITSNTTEEPLEGASVYIRELNKGTSTDAAGNYTITGLSKGIYTLQVSHLGYQTIVSKYRVTEGDNGPVLNFRLQTEPFRINEVVVSNAYVNAQEDNTYRIDVVKKSDMPKNAAVTIMDLINKVQGVDALTTGPLVSRPVIRGLSGNRVLTVVDGTRFETQQWDDEHGIGVNELGLDRIEILKGPASLLYGPEALGGVVHLIPEQPAETGTIKGHLSGSLYSNNLGASANANIKGATEKVNWGVDVLGKLLSDYFYNGYNFRVPNTRLLEYGGKGYTGINGNWGSTTVSYTFNKAYYGILDGKDIVKGEDGQLINIDSLEKEKFPLEIEAPFHAVTDNRINSKTILLTGDSKIEAALGYQNNHRSENEELDGSKKGYTYLDMTLQSYTYDLKWYLKEWKNFHTILGSQGMHQKNLNSDGAATFLIPDATINDLGVLAVTKLDLPDLNFSMGVRYDTRHLQTEEAINSSLNIPVIARDYANVSGSLGVSYHIAKELQLRASYASGYRSPNLNELMSNGVKLESQRFEIGNPDFIKEHNSEFDCSASYAHRDFTVEASVYRNTLYDFIYLAPTGNVVTSNLDDSRMVPEYQFYQSDAVIHGGEARVDVHPSALSWIAFESKFSALTGNLREDDSYLPMMSPSKLYNNLFFDLGKVKKVEDVFFNFGCMTAFEQSEVAANEEQTPSYTILNAALRVVYHKTEATISANNLLDKQYLDHMSRFRAYDIVAPGLNISLNVTIPLDIR